MGAGFTVQVHTLGMIPPPRKPLLRRWARVRRPRDGEVIRAEISKIECLIKKLKIDISSRRGDA